MVGTAPDAFASDAFAHPTGRRIAPGHAPLESRIYSDAD
jgi:hypothetical protein